MFLIVSIIYFYITQTTPKHNGKKQITCVLFTKLTYMQEQEGNIVLAPLDVSWAVSKALYSVCQNTRGRDAHFIRRKNILWGLYVVKKLKVKNQYFVKKKKTWNTKLDISLDLIQNLTLATKVTRLSSKKKKIECLTRDLESILLKVKCNYNYKVHKVILKKHYPFLKK